MFSFAAKWHGQARVGFWSDYHDGHPEMVRRAWELVNEADIIVHYNGKSFDMPHLSREFLLAGLDPPAPHKDIDLMLVTRSRFRFVSNKLDNVSAETLGDRKTRHTGFQLWVDCMNDDPKAWALMKRYNMQDVRLTEQYYDRIRPWIPNHPHMGLYAAADVEVCQNCQSDRLESRGYAYTTYGKYRRYRCVDCGKWNRGKRTIGQVETRAAN